MPSSKELVTLREGLSRYLNYESSLGFPTELNDLLDHVLVAPLKTPPLTTEITQECSFNELVDACRESLLRSGITDNSLTYGYTLARSESLASTTHSHGSSIANVLLKNKEWRQLHQLIGSQRIVKLLTQFNGYYTQGNTFILLFGSELSMSRYQQQSQKVISLDQAMYKEMHVTKFLNPIGTSRQEILRVIFKDEFKSLQNREKIPKRLKAFEKLSSKLIKNHTDFRYFSVLCVICPESELNSTDYLASATPIPQVIKFCTVVFEHLFSSDFYGTATNKSLIFKCLSRLVNGDKGEKIGIEECLSGFKVTSVKWLGRGGHTTSQDDLRKRNRLLRQFIEWLFSEFFTKLLASFFHISHISSAKKLYFFRHVTWKKLSIPHIEKYTKQYLTPIEDPVSVSQSEPLEGIHAKLRIMPKKNGDFRAINIPQKGSTSAETHQYLNHLFKEIRPAKRILYNMRLTEESYFPRLSSVTEIPVRIAQYKRSLINSNNVIPHLYFLKFDAKSCYDTLPQEKILEVVRSMVDPSGVYHFYEQNSVDMDTSKSLRSMKLAEPSKWGITQRKSASMVGSRREHVLKGHEIIAVCEGQLKNTVTKSNKQTYTRKDGIFQGVHMSSLFCDLVYDSLIENKFGFLQTSKSLVLRIADDFLIISDQSQMLVKMRDLANDGFPDYGVIINQLKSASNFGSQGQTAQLGEPMTFCGYEISVDTLEVIKHYDAEMVYTPYVNSHKMALSRMLGIFKIRLGQNTLHSELVHPESIFKQLRILFTNVAQSYYTTVRNLRIGNIGFAEFIREMMKIVLGELKGPMSFDDNFKRRLKIALVEEFRKRLMTKKDKFKHCLLFLDEFMN